MRRKVLQRLIEWKQITGERMPLLLQGARQTGKTYVMRELGSEYFKHTVYVNFEADRQVAALFQSDVRPDSVVSKLEKYYHTEIIPEDTLLIFDEIQASERALTSLKYFAEEAPEYHVVAAGSLLGVALKREHFSFPVGKVRMLAMHPMDFEEYLWAKGKEWLADTIREHFDTDEAMPEALHEEGLQEYYNYCMVGGMPAAVLADCTPGAILKQDEIRQMILDSYIADMAKYADPGETVKIFAAYDSLPAQLAKDSKKFQYKLIRSGARASQYGASIDWLIQAGVVNKCMKCTKGDMPLAAFQDVSSFKLYYSDMGIMSARTGLTVWSMMEGQSEPFRGAFAENYLACALRASGYELNYWESEGQAEVDFLIQKGGRVIPVECKAGEHVRARSLAVYQNRYQPDIAIRVSKKNFGLENGIKSVPLYAAFCI